MTLGVILIAIFGLMAAYLINDAKSNLGAGQALRHQELTIIVLTLAGLAFSALAAYGLLYLFFLRPINSLTKIAGAGTDGNHENEFSPDSDEIGALGKNLADMNNTLRADITKLQELDKQKDEFIKIVSHNLRTPLTIIQSNISFLDNAHLDKNLVKMVKGIEDSARRLSLFSEQMLTITDFESKQGGQLVRQESTLNEILGSLSREYTELATSKGMIFKPQIESGDTKFFTSQYLVAQAVRNILDNAFKFTSEGGMVILSAQLSDKVTIRVSDTGAGISEVELPKLFTKFHRASGTLVYNYEGTGIGLYVTRLIVEQQGGRVYAQSQLGRGSVFTIELPLIKSVTSKVIQ